MGAKTSKPGGSKSPRGNKGMEYQRNFTAGHARQQQKVVTDEYIKKTSSIYSGDTMIQTQTTMTPTTPTGDNSNNNLKSTTNYNLNVTDPKNIDQEKTLMQDEDARGSIAEIKSGRLADSNQTMRDNPLLCPTQPIIWGYSELTRKQLDEDQASFIQWDHPIDGIVHAWCVFDGHGGYETALYCAQHFLNYVKDCHLHQS